MNAQLISVQLVDCSVTNTGVFTRFITTENKQKKAPVLEEGFHSLYPPSLQDLTYEEPIK